MDTCAYSPLDAALLPMPPMRSPIGYSFRAITFLRAVRTLRLVPLALGLAFTAATLAAKSPIQLAQDPTLSPDGKILAFSWRGDLWSVSSAGGTARMLTQHPSRDTSPSFSPDGKRLAFLSDRQGGPQIFVMAASGGVPEQVTAHSEGFSLEGWYPDGSALLANTERDFSYYPRSGQRFFRVKAEAPASEQLVFDDYGRQGDLALDGKRLLFTREGEPSSRKGYRGSQASQIWLYDSGTGTFTQLVAEVTGARSPRWKPDGKGFYFVSARSGSFNLWEYEFAGGRMTQLTKFDNDAVISPCLSRDGQSIVFRHLFDFYRLQVGKGQVPVRLEIWDESETAAPRTDRKILATATDVAFSDDGLEVAFISGGDLWVMDTVLREPRQITQTPEEERDPRFSPDGNSIVFASDQGGQSDLWKAERDRPDDYWWRNDHFKLTRLTNDPEVEQDLQWSPDGRRLAFIKGKGDLWTMEPGKEEAKCVIKSWNRPQFQWSPDGKWFVVAMEDSDFNSDIWLLPSDGTGTPVNISRHPDNESNPTWSPDGRMIAFTGRRVEKEVDIYYVWLKAEDEARDKRDRTLEKAIEKMAKARKKEPARSDKKGPTSASVPKDDSATASTEGAEAATEARPAGARRAKNLPEVKIDFDRIHERVHRISIPNSTERELLWSPDSKKLAFTATIDGRRGTYTVEFPDDLKPKLLCTETGTQGRWLETGNQIVWLMGGSRTPPAGEAVATRPRAVPLAAPITTPPGVPSPTPPAPPPTSTVTTEGSGGVPASVSDAGRVTSYSFRASHEIDLAAKHRAAFDLAWRTMRDSWYDEQLGNRNWDEVRRKYLDAATTPDPATLGVVITMMLGELNGSHLGFTPRTTPTFSAGAWSPVTAHLGVRWDPAHRGPGLKVRDVIPDGPADRKSGGVVAGETVLSIDDVAVDSASDVARVLNGPAGRDVRLRVSSSTGEERTITLHSTRYSTVRSLLYTKWVRDNRAAVEAQSGGKLGYLHVRAMNEESFLQFEQDLYAAGVGRDGLIIDVRDNGGGSTADHLLTALTQPVHAITVPRGGGPGYPQDRKIYATWSKPIVVLCNQNSFSNAEIFSHAIKTLKRGQLVGVPTAGGVVSTGARFIMDVGTLRLPARGWFLKDTGEDMEMNGAVPDHIVWLKPGKTDAASDTQIAKAVEVLSRDVELEKRRAAPVLRKSTDRPEATKRPAAVKLPIRVHAVEPRFCSENETTERWSELTSTRFGPVLLTFSGLRLARLWRVKPLHLD
ncbi:MAG: PDZ domain-containing protein [Opitutus sp.]|nr:PDZ domain-containing protein [Opitutus sp.]